MIKSTGLRVNMAHEETRNAAPKHVSRSAPETGIDCIILILL
jgi:hypothetical protein